MGRIEWSDIQINPLTGCEKGCPYCYARERMAPRFAGRFGYPADNPFRPTFHKDKIGAILNLKGEGKRVFLDSMGDWFSTGVNPDWIREALDAVRCSPQHHFLLLTKWPERIPEVLTLNHLTIPSNLWVGVSITERKDRWRAAVLKTALPDAKKFISFEPLLGPCAPKLEGFEWVIIGAETGNRPGKVAPKVEWIDEIVWAALDLNIPVFLKDNLRTVLDVEHPRQDFPEALLK